MGLMGISTLCWQRKVYFPFPFSHRLLRPLLLFPPHFESTSGSFPIRPSLSWVSGTWFQLKIWEIKLLNQIIGEMVVEVRPAIEVAGSIPALSPSVVVSLNKTLHPRFLLVMVRGPSRWRRCTAASPLSERLRAAVATIL